MTLRELTNLFTRMEEGEVIIVNIQSLFNMIDEGSTLEQTHYRRTFANLGLNEYPLNDTLWRFKKGADDVF